MPLISAKNTLAPKKAMNLRRSEKEQTKDGILADLQGK